MRQSTGQVQVKGPTFRSSAVSAQPSTWENAELLPILNPARLLRLQASSKQLTLASPESHSRMQSQHVRADEHAWGTRGHMVRVHDGTGVLNHGDSTCKLSRGYGE